VWTVLSTTWEVSLGPKAWHVSEQLCDGFFRSQKMCQRRRRFRARAYWSRRILAQEPTCLSSEESSRRTAANSTPVAVAVLVSWTFVGVQETWSQEERCTVVSVSKIPPSVGFSSHSRHVVEGQFAGYTAYAMLTAWLAGANGIESPSRTPCLSVSCGPTAFKLLFREDEASVRSGRRR